MGITSKTKDYRIADVRRAANLIRKCCPWLTVDNHGDYGFRLWVADLPREQAWRLFSPARFEGEVRIMTTDEELEQFIRDRIAEHGPVDNPK